MLTSMGWRLFLTENDPTEWSAADVLGDCYSTQKNDRVLDNYHTNIEHLQFFHTQIWPGIALPEQLVPLQTRKTAQTDNDVNSNVRLVTMPTSMLISFFAWAVSHARRNAIQRAKACAVFHRFLTACFLMAGQLTLRVHPLGSFARTTIAIDVEGTCDAGGFWNPSVWASDVQGAWMRNLLSTAKVWVNSHPGKAHIADFICFALDPDNAKNRKLRGLLVIALEILSQVAAHIEAHILTISGVRKRISTLRRTRLNANRLTVYNMIAKLQSGEDCFHVRIIGFFYGFVCVEREVILK
jgi:hypothetical protein